MFLDPMAWQSRKVRELIQEALGQLPDDQARLICIETPNPERHLERAQNWMDISPLATNAAVLLIDAATGAVHAVVAPGGP